MKIHDLVTELKRRRVFRVAGAYVVGAWIVLQVADVLFPTSSATRRVRTTRHSAYHR